MVDLVVEQVLLSQHQRLIEEHQDLVILHPLVHLKEIMVVKVVQMMLFIEQVEAVEVQLRLVCQHQLEVQINPFQVEQVRLLQSTEHRQQEVEVVLEDHQIHLIQEELEEEVMVEQMIVLVLQVELQTQVVVEVEVVKMRVVLLAEKEL
jgi:hypothetical protein